MHRSHPFVLAVYYGAICCSAMHCEAIQGEAIQGEAIQGEAIQGDAIHGGAISSVRGAIHHEAVMLFDQRVRPILQKCIGCHGADDPQAGLNLTSADAAFESEAIVPHVADRGTLMQRVTSGDPDYRMPPGDDGLSNSEIDTLRQWIQLGAPWPTHWAYRGLNPPRPPVVATSTAWCTSPIDSLVAARLSENRMAPSPPASPAVLLRRVSYDLTGLPPTLEQIEAYRADASPDAYHRVVDRLLASPAYGERWARHWMDVVHFAETHGHDQDRPRDHAWPYRDYLIRRFNADVPFDRFAKEQIAGDALYPDDPWALVATGFLAAGPWDESSLRDIQEDSVDREIARYLDRDDIVSTVMSTFTSTSIHCARCHHHKFDPISQDEYYGLQAIFAGIDKANRPYDVDPQVAIRRRTLQSRLKEIQTWIDQDSEALLSPASQSAVREWEASYKSSSPWQDLTLIELASGAGTNLVKQSDNTIFASGEIPDKDTYVIVAETALKDVAALRLEALADDRLPMSGPGRATNGNFHLSEVRVFAVDADDPSLLRRWTIGPSQSDFDQSACEIALASDGNPNTAWGIHPQVGVSHAAVFALDATAAATTAADNEPPKTRLRIELDQLHGGAHIIGRFQLKVATAAGASQQPLLPLAISQILSRSPQDRSTDERRSLAGYVLTHLTRSNLARLPRPALIYCGTNDFASDGSFRPARTPRDVHILERGDISQPLRPARPTTLSCVPSRRNVWLPTTEESKTWSTAEAKRRAALADWIGHSKNGLFWRAIANRIWHYHVGQPLVDTPNDFGHAGSSPTHPEVLEWLAANLRDGDGRLKVLHRRILTSATYAQESRARIDCAELDGNNRLLWRANRTRLDAESFRDSLLLISDSLDQRMGGPSDRQFVQSKGVHVTPVVDYHNFDVAAPSNRRRSIYRFIFRTLPDPFMHALDCPDASQLTPVRNASVTATQVLATMNDKFVIWQCAQLAERIRAQVAGIDDQVDAAFRTILCRDPRADERAATARFVERHGLDNACRLLVNTNEFMFVD